MTLEDIFLKITMGEDVPSNQDSKPAVNTEKSENSEETEQQENEEGGNE
jgi:hypothetical protein